MVGGRSSPSTSSRLTTVLYLLYTYTHTSPSVKMQPPTARSVVGDMSWSEDSAVAALMVAMLRPPDLASMFDFATRPEALSQRPPRPLRLIVPLSTAAISASAPLLLRFGELLWPARAGHTPEWHPQRTDSAHGDVALNSRTSNRFTGFCVPIQANKEPVGDSNSSYKCAR